MFIGEVMSEAKAYFGAKDELSFRRDIEPVEMIVSPPKITELMNKNVLQLDSRGFNHPSVSITID